MENNKYLAYVFILLLACFQCYQLGKESIKIETAYKYIQENPDEYINYISDKCKKQNDYRKRCIANIEECPEFIKEKKYREKTYKNNPKLRDETIQGVKQNIINTCSHPINIEEYTIDRYVGNYYSTNEKEYANTIDVIMHY